MTEHQNSSNSTQTLKTTADLRADPTLSYKLKVLLFDLHNDESHNNESHKSRGRLLSTTDVLYIGSPYFTPDEAACVKAALVQNDYFQDSHEDYTVENAIHKKLAVFFDERGANTDARQGGYRGMATIYRSVFGIASAELEDERFQSRLRRQGLPVITSDSTDEDSEEDSEEDQVRGSGRGERNRNRGLGKKYKKRRKGWKDWRSCVVT
ncbi:hypothetical protein F4819DRAFT_262821 [Hypoxylon fuscum]|nr:hypothetical protein F4819DRAFT_262821 [Hypoxylon fuscum]